LRVDGAGPGLQELVDAGTTADIEVLPATVRRDGLVVGSIVSLRKPPLVVIFPGQ
jgi:hypothetical protein